MKRPDTPERPKVPIDPADLLMVRDQPEELGLDPASSEASRLGALLREGVASRLERVRRERRIASYAEWAEDEENRQAVAALLADSRERGGALGAFREPVTEAPG